jgi:hypothetical protein
MDYRAGILWSLHSYIGVYTRVSMGWAVKRVPGSVNTERPGIQ